MTVHKIDTEYFGKGQSVDSFFLITYVTCIRFYREWPNQSSFNIFASTFIWAQKYQYYINRDKEFKSIELMYT